MFLPCGGIFALKGIFPHPYHKHFLVLSVAKRIILDYNNGYRNKCLGYAKDLLVYFVKKSATSYGRSFVAYNVHSLIYLSDDANQFQVNLDKRSFFPIENRLKILHQLKRYVKKACNPLAKIIEQVTEMKNVGVDEYHKNVVTKISIENSDCSFMVKNSNVACAKSVQEK